MNILFIIYLFIFGTMFGSFASVVIHRLKSGETGILGGRSHCKTCERNLSPIELIPIISWIMQRGSCKGCKESIGAIYPILEVSTGILFSMVGIFLVNMGMIMNGSLPEILKLLFFLALMFLTVIYVFYDILYLEIPESVLLGANILTIGALVGQSYGITFFPYLTNSTQILFPLIIALSVIGVLYYIMLANLREIYDVLLIIGCIGVLGVYLSYYPEMWSSPLISGTVAALGVFVSFFLQIVLSGGRAMGGGDLRIAILMGLICGHLLTFPAWMICYFVGSVIGVGILLYTKLKNTNNKGVMTEVPFGPFIAAGYLCTLFFHSQVSLFLSWYF